MINNFFEGPTCELGISENSRFSKSEFILGNPLRSSYQILVDPLKGLFPLFLAFSAFLLFDRKRWKKI